MRTLRQQLQEIHREWFGYRDPWQDEEGLISAMCREIVRRGQCQSTVEYRAIRRALVLLDQSQLDDRIPAVEEPVVTTRAMTRQGAGRRKDD